MAAALTPDLALAYVRELSADVRDGVVLDSAGRVLAGPADVPQRSGHLVAARSDTHEIVVECGPFAIEAVVQRDLQAALASLKSAL